MHNNAWFDFVYYCCCCCYNAVCVARLSFVVCCVCLFVCVIRLLAASEDNKFIRLTAWCLNEATQCVCRCVINCVWTKKQTNDKQSISLFSFLFAYIRYHTKQSFTGSVNVYYSSSLFHPLLQSIAPLRRNYVEDGFDDRYLIFTV